MYHLVLLGLATSFAAPALAQLRVLYQNDLSFNASTSALLVLRDTAGSDAASVCAGYSEQLLSSVNSDIEDQLRYLVYTGELQNSSRLHLGRGSSSPALRFARRQQESCNIYNVGVQFVSSGNCSESLPVLCTNSAAPYNANTPISVNGTEVVARSANGSFVGYRDARTFRFLGIPFAASPTGDLRFANAQPYNGSYSNFTATSFGPTCLQQDEGTAAQSEGTSATAANVTNSDGYPVGLQFSEDCLNLNVYTPMIPLGSGGTDQNASLPVAVWIYGGAFTSGSNAISIYDGGNMASRGDVVVVNVNYRLGVLGNMASASLNGSQCISDQIQALRWVQSHISAFGGDPSRVTIFGESAGAQSVLALLSSSPAKGLFNAAVSESAPWLPFFNRETFVNYQYPALLNTTNCTSGDAAAQLACLRSADAQSFVSNSTVEAVTAAASAGWASYANAGPLASAVEPLLPVIGTGIVDGLPNRLIANGTLPSANIPLMIGDVRNEGVGFVDAVITSPLPASEAVLDLVLTRAFDNSTVQAIMNNPTLFAFNTTDPDALRNLAGQLVTLTQWQCPLQQVLSTAANQSTFSSLYSFRIDKGLYPGADAPAPCTPYNPSGYDNVCHAEDLIEVFGSSNVAGIPYGVTPIGYNDLVYNQYVVDTWTSFFRTHSPQLQAAYQNARGRSYQASLATAQAVPFTTFTPNSTIHYINTPPTNGGLAYPEQCAVLQQAGFVYDKVGA